MRLEFKGILRRARIAFLHWLRKIAEGRDFNEDVSKMSYLVVEWLRRERVSSME